MRVNRGALSREIKAAGENLYRLLAEAGLVDAPCGGGGRCGKCGVRFVAAVPSALERERDFFSLRQLQDGWRLACLHHSADDMELELPAPGVAAVESAFARDLCVGGAVWPPGTACSPAEAAVSGYGLALDIGTTTLAAALVDLADGRQVAAAGCLNSQKAYGQDVVSRILHAQSEGGRSALQKAVLDDIKGLLSELTAPLGLDTRAITAGAVAANPTMIHLLAGVDPAPLGRAPYRLAIEGALGLNAAGLGLPLAGDAVLYCLPAVAAYLGGDIVGGITAVELPAPGKTRFFLDIGTNGEMVLARNGELLACSTAAGPALEGMNISCGMRAATGAVDDVYIEGEQVRYTTIGGAPPRGLAGSGLLAAVGALVEAGLVDAGGRLQLRPPVIEEGGQRRLLIDPDSAVALTQADIRQVQLAKGAIRAGVESLLAAARCPAQEVDEVMVAGGFGAHLPPKSLLFTGLLPPAFAGKITYVGNAALAGAYGCLLNAGMKQRAEELAGRVNYIELAELQDYQRRFITAMKFD